MKISVCGSSGRMGRLVINVAERVNHEIVSKIDESTSISEFFPERPDVCIDFSSPAGLVKLCNIAVAFGLPVVSGTTGIQEKELIQIKECSQRIPILISSNFSMGVYALRQLVSKAISVLPDGFDIEIVEKHHSGKKDSPSGTALSLLEDIKEARSKNLKKKEDFKVIFGRHGKDERKKEEICLHSVRGGDVVGEHEIMFLGNGEYLTISHSATNREIFAQGAIYAAEKFLKIKEPGLYSLMDILV